MKIDALMVEDNRADVFMLTEALQQAALDYRLHVARDGQEAMDLLARYGSDALPRLDLVILDLNLPRVNGFEVLRVLRSRPDLREIPTVILTTSAWGEEPAKLDDFDREAFFEKPSLLTDWIAVSQAIDACRRKRMSGDLTK